MTEEVKTIDLSPPTAAAAPEPPPIAATESPAAPEPSTPDRAMSDIEELRRQLASLQDAKVAAEQKASEAIAANMTESERLEKERTEWRTEVEQERTKLRLDLRSAALERAGVLPKYMGFAPDVDVRTTEGQKALEIWINEHPETVASGRNITKPSPIAQVSQRSSRVADIMSGKIKSTLITKKSLSKMFGSN